MGSLVGHVLPGFGFFVIGLWHLLNHIKLHTLNPKSYTALPWFPTSKSRYMELFVIMGGSLASISMELFIGPARHQPLDPDGTIPSTHLHNFEHALISATLFLYAASAIILDKISPKAKAQYGLTVLLGASAFGQELLLFRLHSTDHHGVEGQYHFLLQVVIFISLITTLLAINYPRSFTISFVRSLSILFQGVWLAVMGVMLWTPDFVPKGCFLNFEEGHEIVRCHSDEALNRAKSLVNIEFAWYVILLSVFAVCFYLFLIRIYGNKVEYWSITKSAEQEEEEFDDDDDDVEAQKKSNLMETRRLVPTGKSFIAMELQSPVPNLFYTDRRPRWFQSRQSNPNAGNPLLLLSIWFCFRGCSLLLRWKWQILVSITSCTCGRSSALLIKGYSLSVISFHSFPGLCDQSHDNHPVPTVLHRVPFDF